MNQEGQLGEYSCPVCDRNISNVKSSYLRQQHVEKCISSMNALPTKTEELEFDECVFCGKNLSRYKYNQKQVHLNNCLDKTKEDIDTEVFAGQPVSFLSTLEICPVCHEAAPFLNRNRSQKLRHTKKCAKDRRLTLSQLLQKFQWLGWGHLPIESTSSSSITVEDTPSPTPTPTYSGTSISSHRLQTTHIHNINTYNDDMDDDFSTNIIIHKSNYQLQATKRNREEDRNDEELQMVLGLSKSMSINEPITKKKKLGVHPSNERDWNAASIASIEESRKDVVCKLDEMLFPDNELELFKQNEREKSIGYLGESNIKMIANYNDNCTSATYYWNLASNKEQNWDDPFVFRALFLRRLSHKA